MISVSGIAIASRWRRRRTHGLGPRVPEVSLAMPLGSHAGFAGVAVCFAAPTSVASPQQAREPSVLEYSAFRLARRAVVDRVLLEVDARERRAVAGTRIAELVVHAVGLRVVRAR